MASQVRDFLKTKVTPTTERGADRAAQILRTAQDIVIEEGFTGLSMRGLAARVGISLGNLQHYYASKELLLSTLVHYLMDGYQTRLAVALADDLDKTPEQRLEDGIAQLLDEVQDPRTCAVFLELWALSTRVDFAASLLEKVHSRELKAMRQLVKGLSNTLRIPHPDLRPSMMVCVIEGLLPCLGRSAITESTRKSMIEAARKTILRIAREGV
jgi:AcrR family transcriptional regulator